MKQNLAISFILFFQLTTYSQKITIDTTSNVNYHDLPDDQVFLHLDRNLYIPGDTIRFQAYIRDRLTGVFETKSISLFSLLLDQSLNTIDSARFRISSSTSSGWLKIPNSAPFGDYSIITFTSYSMNYNPNYVFSAQVRVGDPNIIQTGLNLSTRTNINDLGKSQVTKSEIDLRFLPEGGNFIYDTNQRIAFNAVTSTGNTLHVNGEILNQRDEKIINFSSGQFGPGLFEFKPISGDSYFATLNGEEYSGIKWPLPLPQKYGVVIRVNNSEESIIDILVNGRNINIDSFSIVLSMNGIHVVTKDFKMDSTFNLKINTNQLPAGTAMITLYDSQLNPVSERLAFINDHKKLKIKIDSPTPLTKTGDESELIISTTDISGNQLSSIISVSVIDSATGYYYKYPISDIESKLLFDEFFYNNLPLKIKVHGLSDIDRETLDLLLMTYGWRKYTLNKTSQSIIKSSLMDYDNLLISTTGPVKYDRSNISITSLENPDILTIPVNDRKAILSFNSLNQESRHIIILPDNKPSKNLNKLSISFPSNQDFITNAKKTLNNFTVSESSTYKKEEDKPEFSLDTVIVMQGVTIQGKRTPNPAYINKTEELYKYTNTTTLTGVDFEGCFYFEDVIRRYNPYYINTIEKYVILRPVIGSFRKGANPAMFVLNDVPVGLNYHSLAWIPASQISSITILKGSQGYSLYRALGGIIFVNTKTERPLDNDLENKNNLDAEKTILMRPIYVFRPEVEFYLPNKEEGKSTQSVQNTPTIFWENEILLDGNGPARIKYTNNNIQGTVIVIINGVSFSNSIGHKLFKYRIY